MATLLLPPAWIGLSFALGRLHPQFLTCDDFTSSGNDVPADYTPGQASLR